MLLQVAALLPAHRCPRAAGSIIIRPIHSCTVLCALQSRTTRAQRVVGRGLSPPPACLPSVVHERFAVSLGVA